MKGLKILFVASEVEGFAKTGGLADVARALPEALQALGHDVMVVMPDYPQMRDRGEREMVLANEKLTAPGAMDVDYQVACLRDGEFAVHAIECGRYFDRQGYYGEQHQGYQDNGERFAFFCAAALDCAKKLNFQADVVHCNDWHTGLIPFLLKTRYAQDPMLSKAISVLTIHNAVYQGVYGCEQLALLPELQQTRHVGLESGFGRINFLKVGVSFADKINAVSPNYANELLTELGSHGMAQTFYARRHDFQGILNGCDTSSWNPEIDPHLPQSYRANKTSLARGKKAAKKALQQQLGLAENNAPLYGMVCRLTEQKGIQLLLPILSTFLTHQVQMVIVGTGDPLLSSALAELAAAHPEKLVFIDAYDNALAHLVEAASDFFVMPSIYEPCGLNQIYSMAYGTVPIVRQVGGLADTVTDFHAEPLAATGFTFADPTPVALLITLQRSLLVYCQDQTGFKEMQLRGMQQDHRWEQAAATYVQLYFAAKKRQSHRAKRLKGAA
ncbi:Glycogen synthase [Vibrio stylophorae]|uniref:Glycogen synthase n=1 Tax=Vibrio stylophorae TaxID=659351 RepID=A0ABM8ZY55_9VIBR|nr:glycogen synthase GlgA [Vibrio stylophorae]CAH0535782.1 Glycogen synthase [Vibrio stylophorae]